jgi:UDP-N-acetylmuramoyl-tripeptide--D-alanyl-D-alanine ligase
LAVLAAAQIAGADLALAGLALGEWQPLRGRGQMIKLDLGKGGIATLIDESYNANPASMRAALEILSRTPVGPRGRRIAVLGDMLELGAAAGPMHEALAQPIAEHGIDLVFCAGLLMQALWNALPPERRGGYAEGAALLEPELLAALCPGDAIMVKGSNASNMASIVANLLARFRASAPANQAAV